MVQTEWWRKTQWGEPRDSHQSSTSQSITHLLRLGSHYCGHPIHIAEDCDRLSMGLFALHCTNYKRSPVRVLVHISPKFRRKSDLKMGDIPDCCEPQHEPSVLQHNCTHKHCDIKAHQRMHRQSRSIHWTCSSAWKDPTWILACLNISLPQSQTAFL